MANLRSSEEFGNAPTPIQPTPTGFNVTYSRSKSAVFSGVAGVFAIIMVATGLDVYFSLLDGTRLSWLEIDRRPAWAWGGVLILGGMVLFAVVLWSGATSVRSRAAIKLDEKGVQSLTFIGKRSISWADAGAVSVVNKTMIVYPADQACGKPVPLQTFLTSVSIDELRSMMAQHRPELLSGDL